VPFPPYSLSSSDPSMDSFLRRVAWGSASMVHRVEHANDEEEEPHHHGAHDDASDGHARWPKSLCFL
jgi:hypothetical protein